MSSSLVRKALELYDGDLPNEPVPKERNIRTDDNVVKKRQLRKSNKKKKNLIEKYREKQNAKYTEKNLNWLQDIAKSKESSKEMLRKIVLKSGMCSARDLKKQKKRPKPQTSVFNDTDFEKFEKEYFS